MTLPMLTPKPPPPPWSQSTPPQNPASHDLHDTYTLCRLIFLAEQIPPSSEEDSCYLFSSCYQCTTVCSSSWKQWKNKIHGFELQQLQLGFAQGIGCLGFSLSLSLSARELNALGFGSLRIFSPSLDQGIECSGSCFSQGSLSLSLSLSLSVFTGSGF